MVTVHQLSRQDARRIAVRAQCRPDGVARLGNASSPGDLRAALDNRDLIELRGMIHPAEDLALHRADMAAAIDKEISKLAAWLGLRR
ncbi:hypothetical protein [Actinocrispum sp. NPDC049592]|uniref:hypothetical protein n=1 Tax=Actinocrispum sp. NPDC049592 TaxID=3154835 RepID=UPI00343E4151